MQAHMRTHLTRDYHESDSISGDEFFYESFGDTPPWAIAFSGLRHREDLSQVEFAMKLGITQSNVSAIESGKKPIVKKLANRIAMAFKTNYRLFL